MDEKEPQHESVAGPEIRCRTAERNVAIAGLLLTLVLATAIAILPLLGGGADWSVSTAQVPSSLGPGSSETGDGQALATRKAVLDATPPEPQPSEDPGGSASGSGDSAGSGETRGAAEDAFGFTVTPTKQHSVSGNETAAEFATDEGGGSDGDGGIGNGEGGGVGDGRGVGEFMGIAATGKRIAFVIDRSGSMVQGDRIFHTKLELKRTIELLDEEHEFFVVLFNTVAEPMPGGKMVRADKRSKARVFGWLNDLGANDVFGSTDPSEAMKFALATKPDTVFLMTDGQFDAEPTMNVLRAAGVGGDGGAVINTIAFHLRDGEEALVEIARISGGTYRYVPPAGAAAPEEPPGAAP